MQWWVVVDHTGDWGFFRAAAGLVFGGQVGVRHLAGGIHTYVSAPELQFGPPPVLLAQLARVVGGSHAATVFAILGMALVLPTLWALERAAVDHGRSPEWAQGAVLVLGVPVVYGWGQLTIGASHLDDAIVLCAAALALVVGRRWVFLVPLAVGTAIAAKPWGVACLPLATLAGTRRWRPVLLAVAVAVVWWSPFLLDPRTVTAAGTQPLPAMPGTLLHLLIGGDTLGGYWRSVQLAAILGAATVSAKRGGYAGALLAGISVRIMLDPSTYTYYWTGLVVAAVMHDLLSTRPTRFTASAAATAALLLRPTTPAVAVVHVVLLVVCLAQSLQWPDAPYSLKKWVTGRSTGRPSRNTSTFSL